MKIKSATLFKTIFRKSDFPKNDFCQVVFSGRSNVGKSTLINSICKKNNLAKTSSIPGKTQSVNYFLINENFYLVDLPGYGFAKSSKDERVKWQKLIESYFENNEKIKLVFLLIDIRHILLESDQRMIDWLTHYNLPFTIILTKSDKVTKNEMVKNKNKIISTYNKNNCFSDVLVFSNKEPKTNIDILTEIEKNIT